jgi:NAD(P)-dependent dehydrogenase (short-subunit alcohol dehydrogenase family)
MGILRIALMLAGGTIAAQLLFSYIAGGWVAKYTSPPYSFDDIPNLAGKVAIVTGTNTGIGYVTARELARKGATVIATARSKSKGESAIAKMKSEIGSSSPVDIRFMELDLASFENIRAFSREYIRTGELRYVDDNLCVLQPLHTGLDIDIMVLNAGIMMSPFGKTVDGFEMQIGTNHLGHFLLVKSLLPLIAESKKTEPVRVVHVSSAAHEMSLGMQFDNWDNDKDYNEM